MAIQAHNKRSQDGHTSIRTAYVQQQQSNEPKAITGPGNNACSKTKQKSNT